MNGRPFITVAVAVVLAARALAAQAPPPPVPTPTPKPTPASTAKPTPVAPPVSKPAAASQAASTEPALTGVPLYPGASLLLSVDLGGGQRLFVFGTADLFASVVAFYKGQLGKSTEVTKTPAIQQFDLGSFDSGRMSQRPSVIVKDFTWPDAAGYLHVSGTTETRYKTLIQIIPATK